jgi:hypothetical protein
MNCACEMFGNFQFSFYDASYTTTFAVTSARSLRCHASTCSRIGSKFRCMRSTPTEMQSVRENDFECLASTGVKTAVTQKLAFILNAL